MKISTRYIIFLICFLFFTSFLIPKIKWYRIFDEKDRNDATLEAFTLKSAVTQKTDEAISHLSEGAILKNELKILNKEFKKEVRIFNKANPSDKKDLSKNYSYQEIKDILLDIKGEKGAESFFKNILEDYYIDYFDKKKKVKDSIIKLGLDLQGGAYAVVTINFNDPQVKEKIAQRVEKAKEGKEVNESDINKIIKREKDSMIESAIIKIENRINKYGLSETSIQKVRGQDKILINLPGVKDISELRDIIETVGVLEFKLVSKEGSEELYRMKREADSQGIAIFDSDRNLLPEYNARLQSVAPDTEVLFISKKDKWGNEQELKEMLAVEKESLLGENPKITSATVDSDQYGRNVVNFTLDDKDAKKWAQVTGDNINREIAIILDDIILTNPVVDEKIPTGRSQIRLGDSPLEELNTLALILRSGSLNVPLEISEEQTIGASLGRDTIRKGLIACLYGIIFVTGFMIIWYSIGGFIADLAVLLNILLLISGLALFRGTLTLPGIAGIILTIGMAVDANVIIFERIIEEFRSGKTFKTAVNVGFNKAFWTIMDANITTFVAGIGLSLFGTGPIKGFAVTLCLGIITTLFTSLFVSRLVFDSLLTFIDFKSLRLLSVFRGK
jgi:protein-export membrane protein SecD